MAYSAVVTILAKKIDSLKIYRLGMLNCTMTATKPQNHNTTNSSAQRNKSNPRNSFIFPLCFDLTNSFFNSSIRREGECRVVRFVPARLQARHWFDLILRRTTYYTPQYTTNHIPQHPDQDQDHDHDQALADGGRQWVELDFAKNLCNVCCLFVCLVSSHEPQLTQIRSKGTKSTKLGKLHKARF